MSLPPLFLKAKSERRIKLGHLWIYSNEVDVERTPLKNFAAGDQALVCDAKGKALGVAFINPNTLICGRLFTRSTHALSSNLLKERITAALSLREQVFNQPYYRLIYGDSDLLPGVVVDRFGEVLVVQVANAGMERCKEDLIAALIDIVQPKGIVLSNEHSARDLEQLPHYTSVVYGKVAEDVALIENNTEFLAPILSGQKTGWFYDHRINRATLQSLAKDKHILDVFSYIGGWGIEATTAGAKQVTCVDASATALERVAENARRNNVADKVNTLHGKAVDVLKDLISDKQQFDIVVLDPPAFIKKRKDQKAGEAAYRHINELAIRLLGKDGLLVSASCSMHLTRETLQDIVRGSARHLDRHAQVIGFGGQGPDHPIHPAITETNYLKALFARVYLER